jgi:hypothetical protein
VRRARGLQLAQRLLAVGRCEPRTRLQLVQLARRDRRSGGLLLHRGLEAHQPHRRVGRRLAAGQQPGV